VYANAREREPQEDGVLIVRLAHSDLSLVNGGEWPACLRDIGDCAKCDFDQCRPALLQFNAWEQQKAGCRQS
jgi:hypothetical protein